MSHNVYHFSEMAVGDVRHIPGDSCITRTPSYAALRKYMERHPEKHFRASRTGTGFIQVKRTR